MNKLIRFELKKVGWFRIIIVLIIFTLPMLYIYQVVCGGRKAYNQNTRGTIEFYDDYCGDLTSDKLTAIQVEAAKISGGAEGAGGISESGEITQNSVEYDEYSNQKGKYGHTIAEDSAIFSVETSRFETLQKVAEGKDIVLENVQNNLDFLDEESDAYEIRFNKMIGKMAEKLENPKYMPSSYYDLYFTSNEYVKYAIPIIVILLCGIFTKDRESGMFALLRSSKSGRWKLFIAKFSAMAILCFIVALYFQIMNYLLPSIAFGLRFKYLLYPMSSVVGFSLFNYSILEYALVQLLIRTVTMIALGSLIMGISMLVRKTVISALISAGVMGIIVGIPYYVMSSASDGLYGNFYILKLAGILKKWLFSWGLFTHEYFREVDAVNIFGYPLRLSIFIPLSSVVVAAVAFAVFGNVYCRKKTKI